MFGRQSTWKKSILFAWITKSTIVKSQQYCLEMRYQQKCLFIELYSLQKGFAKF